MRHFLVVVDMQKDFVDGALGTLEAQAIIPAAVEKIRNWDGELFVTYDTHFEDYLETAEGKKLPVPHCIYGTPGWELNDEILQAVEEKPHAKIQKYTFGSTALPRLIDPCPARSGAADHGKLPDRNTPCAHVMLFFQNYKTCVRMAQVFFSLYLIELPWRVDKCSLL